MAGRSLRARDRHHRRRARPHPAFAHVAAGAARGPWPGGRPFGVHQRAGSAYEILACGRATNGSAGCGAHGGDLHAVVDSLSTRCAPGTRRGRDERPRATQIERIESSLAGWRDDGGAAQGHPRPPELAWHEVRTSAVVTQALAGAGLEPISSRAAPDSCATSWVSRRDRWWRCAPTSTPCRSTTRRMSRTARPMPVSPRLRS